jgi:hypothetical protein
VSVPKSKKDAPAGESESRKPKRNKEKLIQLDDLIPKKDVRGGRQLLFGAADTQQPTQIEKE